MAFPRILSRLVQVSVLIALSLVAASASQAAIITVVNLDDPNEGFNDPTPATPVGGNAGTTIGAQRLIAFQYAADLWAGRLSSAVEIRIDAHFDPMPCNALAAVLGAAGPTLAFADFSGALVPGTLYVAALANALHGSDLDPNHDDILATFNSSIGTTCSFPITWYYGLDGNPATNQTDLVSVVLHELGHGLGFKTLVDLATGAKLAGLNDSYMLNLERHGATPPDYPSMTDDQRVAASMDTGNLHWVGPTVKAASALLSEGKVGDHVQMYAPNPQEPGSSVSHWDTALNPSQLMEPFYSGPNHDPVLEGALFHDIGWTVTGPPTLVIDSISLTGGNGNGVIDVNECNNLTVTLRNVGGSAATGVSAALAFNGPGLTIAQAGSAYPDIPPGGTATNTTPFRISTAPGFACGSNADLTLTVTIAGGDVFMLPMSLGSGTTTTARFDNDTPLQIPDPNPDPQTVQSTVTVAGITTPVTKVTVSLFIDHTFDGDLEVELEGPDGTRVPLTLNNGFAGANYGAACSPDSSRTTFDDAAPTSILEGSAPFVGTFRPEGALAAFIGKSGAAVNGTWKLRITDDFQSDTGTLHCWSLLISVAACANGGAECALPPAGAAKLGNFAARGSAGTGNNQVFGGVIIQGSTPKTVLLRGRGPSLGAPPFNIPGALANPVLRLFSGSTQIGQNDNWQDAPNCTFACGTPAQIIATGLDPCQPNPGQATPPPGCTLEAAILVTLPPGAYTFILSGAAGGTGVSLVEAFEVDDNTSSANLQNMATRLVVGTGNQIGIMGVIIVGNGSKQVLFRGRGPSLGGAPFNLPAVLPDPILAVFSGATMIAVNNNWQDQPNCSQGFTCGTAADITATGLDPCQPNPGQMGPPPNCALESAILMTLAPGAYTVQLSGAGGSTGVGLMELFDP